LKLSIFSFKSMCDVGSLITRTMILVLCLSVFCAGCSKVPKVLEPAEKEKGFWSHIFGSKPVDEGDETGLLNKGLDYFNKGRYSLAAETFQKLKDRYPFSPYATLAELRVADSKFYNGDYEEAIPLYEEFEKLHPNNEAIPYVLFQIGMCHYKLMSTPNRDQTNTHKLIQTYDRLLKKFPNSPYSQGAQVLRAEARNELALHELSVAEWYLKTHQVKQARLRLQNAIKNYPETVAAGQAQELLAKLPPEELESQQIEKPLLKRLLPFM